MCRCTCSCVVDQLREGDVEPSGLPSLLAVGAPRHLEMALVSWSGDSRHAINKAEHVKKRSVGGSSNGEYRNRSHVCQESGGMPC